MSDFLFIGVFLVAVGIALNIINYQTESSDIQNDAANIAMIDAAKINDDEVVQARAVIAKADLMKAQEVRAEKESVAKYRKDNPEIAAAENRDMRNMFVSSFIKIFALMAFIVFTLFCTGYLLNEAMP